MTSLTVQKNDTIFRPSGTLSKRWEKKQAGESFQPSLDDKVEALARVIDFYQMDHTLVWNALQLARLQPGLSDDDYFATTMLVTILHIALNEGSTCLQIDGLNNENILAKDPTGYIEGHLKKLCGFMAELPEEYRLVIADDKMSALYQRMFELCTREHLNQILGEIRTDSDRQLLPYRPLILEQGLLYPEQFARLERRLVHNLHKRNNKASSVGNTANVETYIAEISNSLKFKLEGEQCDAMRASVESPFVLISGGPGTGKTTSVLSILRLLMRLGIKPNEVALAAPTGKAAKRMHESIIDGFDTIVPTHITDADSVLKRDLEAPQTLHRLLSYSPHLDVFQRNHLNPIDARVIIVDEASMIDLMLMTALLEATPPNATLILLGDTHQLPSVNTGAVFRDLMLGGQSAVAGMQSIELIKSRRMDLTKQNGLNIYVTSLAVNSGNTTDHDAFFSPVNDITSLPFWKTLCERTSDTALAPESILTPFITTKIAADITHAKSQGMTLLATNYIAIKTHDNEERQVYDKTSLAKFIELWFERYNWFEVADDKKETANQNPTIERTNTIAYAALSNMRLNPDGSFTHDDHNTLKNVFAHISSSRILCLTRTWVTGTRAINRKMHELHKTKHGRSRTQDFYTGEPVMMLRNDYDLNLFNGDQGVVISYKPHGQFYSQQGVVFQLSKDRYRLVDINLVKPHIEHCFAMTVHKSQGSEFDNIAIILPDENTPLLTREILYTGITRAKNSVTLYGTKDKFLTGVKAKLERFTGLQKRLDVHRR